MGSRGLQTDTAPSPTRTVPEVKPPERRVTPITAEPVANTLAQPAPQSGFAQRNPFLTGLMGGVVGAGIGSILLGHGFGLSGLGFAGGLGPMFQLALLGALAWLAFSFFRARRGTAPMAYSSLGIGGCSATPEQMVSTGSSPNSEPRGSADEIGIIEADFTEFERLLGAVQDAWSKSDIPALRRLATPEMLGYFSEQLAVNTSRGVTNTVETVKLEQGDPSQSWREGTIEYATIAMRFSALDYHSSMDDGQVVEGSETQRVEATEVWTFMRQVGGRWILSAFQN